MTAKKLNEVVQYRVERINKVLREKGEHYIRGVDRLANFKVAGAMQSITSKQALLGMWAKHIVSIMDLIERDAHGNIASYEVWDEKLTDSINYMILLDALVKENLYRVDHKEVSNENS